MDIQITGVDQVGQMADFWDLYWPDRVLVLTGESVVEDTRLRLEDDETSPGGKAWDPWSDNPPGRGYASRRPPTAKLLYDSGDLARSIEYAVQGNTVDVGSELDYALVHQMGSRDGRIPAREYAGISDELESALQDVYSADFEGGWLAVRA
jgi:phage gpG-like protein